MVLSAGKGEKLSPRLSALSGSSGFSTMASAARVLSLPASGAGSLVRRSDGALVVQIRAEAVSHRVLAGLESRNARIVSVSPEYSTVTAAVMAGDLATLAADPAVRYVAEVLAPQIGAVGARPGVARSSVVPPPCGSTTSEGDALMNVGAARTASAIDGSGGTVGILSDSFATDMSAPTSAVDDVSSGDLPGPGNPCGRTTPVAVGSDYSGIGQADEGRAMAQLVHDLAPGARLAFRTAFNGDLDFARQITLLGFVEQANVIVDDVAYLNEPFFQNGPIAQAAAAASTAGVPYFSAAGNSNVIVGGRDVSSYEAPSFRSTACPASVLAVEPLLGCHDFDPSGGTDNGDRITLGAGGTFGLDLQWAQPWSGVTTDYDVFLVDAAGAVVARSWIDNVFSREPFEFFGYTNSTGTTQTLRVVIAKYAGATDARLKFVLMGASGITGVQYDTSSGGDVVGPTIFGHSGAASVGSTAAIPYSSANTSESYSSRGPVTLYFADTPSTLPLGAPLVLDKPDFAATDGVATTFFGQAVAGVRRFYGTSAAAPHAAAIGALLQAKDPALTPAEVIATLRSTARPVAVNGAPSAVGGGYLDANAALASVVPRPGAPRTVSAVAGDGRATVSWWPGRFNPNVPNTGYVVTPILAGVAQAPQSFGSTATTEVVTGLTNGASYAFAVAAVNVNGAGPMSLASLPITVGAPLPPRLPPTAVPGNASATVTWAAPANAADLTITSYSVTPYIAGVAQTARVFGPAATTRVVTGLANGTSYTFKVSATTAYATSSQSGASNPITVGTPVVAAAPTASPGSGTATVRWKVPATNNGAAITGYVVTPYFRGYQAMTPLSYGATTTSAVISGLTNGETYTFTVAATNGNGMGPASPASEVFAVGGPVAPAAPSATPGNSSATIKWIAPADNGSPVTSYRVSVKAVTTGTGPSYSYSGTATSYTIFGLTNGVAYRFSVSAANGFGSGPWSSPSPPVTVGSPGAPPAPVAVPGNGSVVVKWTAPANNGSAITSYVVTPYLSGVALAARTVAPSATATTIGGLTNSRTYVFTIAAVNARGTGPASTTTPVVVGAPTAPTVSAVGSSGQAVVAWTSPVANGSPVGSYVVSVYVGGILQTASTHVVTCSPSPCDPSRTWTVTGLTNGTTYAFKVAAVNANGTGPTGATTILVSSTPVKPGAPLAPRATAGVASAAVSWVAPGNGTATIGGYTITTYVNGVAQGGLAKTFNSPATTQMVAGLASGTTYTFRIAAKSVAGTGVQSVASNPVTPA